MVNFWTKFSGTKIATLQEGVTTSIELPLAATENISSPDESFNVEDISVSNTTGSYPSSTEITLIGAAITITSDGDPYPALAGDPLTNTDTRLFPNNSNDIADQTHQFTFNYRAGTNSNNPQLISEGAQGITTNGVVIFNPSAGSGPLPGSAVDPLPGFNWNAVFYRLSYGVDAAGGNAESNGEYHYRSGNFLTHGYNTEKFISSNSYYNSSQHDTDNFRHTDGHSKILGFCFDGYPIYGPYGYSTPGNNTSGIRQQTSSYKTKVTEAIGRGFSYSEYPAGAFLQDYEYVKDLGTLDEHNGRFCVTPDFPGGTYAYFLTFENNNLTSPTYPYIIGPTTKEQRTLGVSQSLAKTEIISGNLPLGMNLKDNIVKGTPFEVPRDTEYKFVVRASYNNQINDRTFTIDVQGPDEPQWITEEGILPVGNNNTYFILDNSPIDFQLIVKDSDTEAGQVLEYFLGSGDGELPPGITLTEDGRLVGIVDPILAIEKRIDIGNYDMSIYDNPAYDFGVRSSNGFDSFFYDTTIYDLSIPTRSPRKLNRFYEFIISVNDGDTIARRKFLIYVVGDDFVRVDNTIMEVSTGVFTADNTHIRVPIWLTPRDFGFRRANNYVTLFLDVLDTNELLGVVTYTLQTANDDGSLSTLPPGMILDSTTGEVAGRVPYQPSVTKEYKFTVKAARFGPTSTKQFVTLSVFEDTLSGQSTLKTVKNFDAHLLINRSFQIDEQSFTITKVDTTNENFDLISLGKNITITVFENALPSQNLIKINKVGAPFLNDLIGQNLKFGEHTLQISAVNDNNKIYRCKVSHTSDSFASDLQNSHWEEVTGADLAAIDTSTVLLWNTEHVFSEDDLVKYNIDLFETVTINTNLTSTVFAGSNTTLELIPLSLRETVKKGETFEFNLFTDNANEVAESNKTFVVKTLGEVDSVIKWVSKENLASIDANYISNLELTATSTVPNANLIYALTKGRLPPGLTLLFDGSISGKVRIFADTNNIGLTITDTGTFTLDNNITTIDRKFIFTARVQDQFGYSAVEKEFFITVGDPDNKTYSNLYARPFLKLNQKTLFKTFISNPEVFEPSFIYRPDDPLFGIQREIKMLVYPGIETKNINHYVGAIAKNHKRKKFKLGNIKTAVAKLPGTNDIVYEIVYVEVIDPYMPTNGKTKKEITIRNSENILVSESQFGDTPIEYISFDVQLRNGEPAKLAPFGGITSLILRNGTIIDIGTNAEIEIIFRNLNTSTLLAAIASEFPTFTSPWYLRSEYDNVIKIDSDAIDVSDGKDQKRYISNIENMRDNLATVGTTELNFLPLWMRTAQEGSLQELGFTPAIPLCYTKPGTSKKIATTIKLQNFDFTQIDFDIDRYIIDNTTGNSNEQYLLFANYQFNI